MHPTRREMLRLGLGSSALLACGPTVPLFLARSANAMADDGRRRRAASWSWSSSMAATTG